MGNAEVACRLILGVDGGDDAVVVDVGAAAATLPISPSSSASNMVRSVEKSAEGSMVCYAGADFVVGYCRTGRKLEVHTSS